MRKRGIIILLIIGVLALNVVSVNAAEATPVSLKVTPVIPPTKIAVSPASASTKTGLIAYSDLSPGILDRTTFLWREYVSRITDEQLNVELNTIIADILKKYGTGSTGYFKPSSPEFPKFKKLVAEILYRANEHGQLVQSLESRVGFSSVVASSGADSLKTLLTNSNYKIAAVIPEETKSVSKLTGNKGAPAVTPAGPSQIAPDIKGLSAALIMIQDKTLYWDKIDPSHSSSDYSQIRFQFISACNDPSCGGQCTSGTCYDRGENINIGYKSKPYVIFCDISAPINNLGDSTIQCPIIAQGSTFSVELAKIYATLTDYCILNSKGSYDCYDRTTGCDKISDATNKLGCKKLPTSAEETALRAKYEDAGFKPLELTITKTNEDKSTTSVSAVIYWKLGKASSEEDAKSIADAASADLFPLTQPENVAAAAPVDHVVSGPAGPGVPGFHGTFTISLGKDTVSQGGSGATLAAAPQTTPNKAGSVQAPSIVPVKNGMVQKDSDKILPHIVPSAPSTMIGKAMGDVLATTLSKAAPAKEETVALNAVTCTAAEGCQSIGGPNIAGAMGAADQAQTRNPAGSPAAASPAGGGGGVPMSPGGTADVPVTTDPSNTVAVTDCPAGFTCTPIPDPNNPGTTDVNVLAPPDATPGTDSATVTITDDTGNLVDSFNLPIDVTAAPSPVAVGATSFSLLSLLSVFGVLGKVYLSRRSSKRLEDEIIGQEVNATELMNA